MGRKKDVLESDKRLLQFRTYDEYLDFLVSKVDICYFRNYFAARKFAELGYRSSGDMLSKEEFYKKLADVTEALFHSKKIYELSSMNMVFDDVMYNELANREQGNRIGLVATIIFIRYLTADGYEVSGYIDYAERLLNENWGPFFRGKKKLRIRTSDLALFNWRNKKAYHNDSDNYKLFVLLQRSLRPASDSVEVFSLHKPISGLAICYRISQEEGFRRLVNELCELPTTLTEKVIFDTDRGLMFKNKRDHKLVLVDPYLPNAGTNTFRERIFTKHFDHFVLYDHYLMQQN